ncbi:toll-like receptor 4 [Mercenaria mercenaria]|uniref:toll-like receptor 4 n=1 Tax=Mercenaria mercenaria TaxID=6596 RepID=UPI00234F76DC|nr:toll-like receptor 4 [Mercenaria mercenaria]
MEMFSANVDLDTIDLSSNKLRQVTFLLKHLGKLQVLNLRNNLIHILDEISMSHLDSIYDIPRHNDSYPSLILMGNNLSCSTCDANTFIKWLLGTKILNITSQNLTCTNENGKQTTIEQSTLGLLKKVCYFTFHNAIICVSVAFISVIMAIASVKACKIWHRYEVIQRLRVGNNQYRHAALLVYHEDDTSFVKGSLVKGLKDKLRSVTNIENENLIKESEDVEPGHSFGTELGDVVNRSSVVIAVASSLFCEDHRYSRIIEEALEIGKPIILFLIDGSGIDRKNMTSVMKQLLRVKPRFVWKIETDGQRKMKTTWRNVCNTILDYIK